MRALPYRLIIMGVLANIADPDRRIDISKNDLLDAMLMSPAIKGRLDRVELARAFHEVDNNQKPTTETAFAQYDDESFMVRLHQSDSYVKWCKAAMHRHDVVRADLAFNLLFHPERVSFAELEAARIEKPPF